MARCNLRKSREGTFLKEYTVKLYWDGKANVWVASENILGLALESDSLYVLIERVKLAVPELLTLNACFYNEPYSLRFVLSAL